MVIIQAVCANGGSRTVPRLPADIPDRMSDHANTIDVKDDFYRNKVFLSKSTIATALLLVLLFFSIPRCDGLYYERMHLFSDGGSLTETATLSVFKSMLLHLYKASEGAISNI